MTFATNSTALLDMAEAPTRRFCVLGSIARLNC